MGIKASKISPVHQKSVQKRAPASSKRNMILKMVFVVVLLVASTMLVFLRSGKSTLANASFSFSFAGDYDQTSNTTATLNTIGNLASSSSIAFNLALGDMNYNYPNVSAQQWSNYAKNKMPGGFPFEIIAGEHDTGDLSQLATYLPNYMSNITGTYSQEYYFDYPSTTPLARFILVSPNVLSQYNYKKGGADYNWVKNAIDAARQAGIQWVIVGMHEYCFAIGYAKCLNQDFLDMLLNEHVDVILQAQKHNYQRSKQLALNPTTCPTLDATSYNANCVVNSSNSLTQGAGSVIVLTGTGGASQLKVDATDPKAGYFKTWTPSNNITWGITQFTLSTTQLTAHFVRSSGGSYTDSFTITASTPTPTTTASASPSATITPSPSATITPSPSATTTTTILGQDTFQRPNQTYWGTASDGQTWGADANSVQAFSINNNLGHVVAGTNRTYNAILGPVATNAQVEFSGTLSSFTGTNLGAALRYTNSSNWYRAYIDGSNLVIQKRVSGSNTRLAAVPFAATPGTSYTLLFSVTGSTLSASVWNTNAGSQPASWMVTATDTTFASGSCGLSMYLTTGVTADISAFLAVSQ